MYVMYILESLENQSYYIGSTSDIEGRLKRHNKGYSRYIKGKGPFKIVYIEKYETLSEARKREYYIKSLKSRVAIDKLIAFGAFV